MGLLDRVLKPRIDAAVADAADAAYYRGREHGTQLARESYEAHNTEMNWRARQNYVDITGKESTGRLSPAARIKEVERSRAQYLYAPLMRRAVDLTASFIFGRGVGIPAVDKDAEDAPPNAERVESVIHEFWTDPVNRHYLTDPDRQIELARQLLVDGEVPLVVFSEGAASRVVVGDTLDFIDAIEHPLWPGFPMLWRRQADNYGIESRLYWSAESAMATDEDKAKVLDSLSEADRKRVQQADDGTPKGVVLMWRVSSDPRGMRGQPPMMAAFDWVSATQAFASDLRSYTRAVTAIVSKLKMQGTAAELSAAATAAKSNLSMTQGLPAPVGSMRIEGEGQDYSFLNVPTGGDRLFQVGFELCRLMVAAGTGLSVHYLGDPSTGNLATANAMELPQVKLFEGWQLWFTSQFDRLFVLVADRAGIDTATTDVTRLVNIDFPDIVTADAAQLINSLSQAHVAGVLSTEDAARYTAYAIGADDVEDVVERATAGDVEAEKALGELYESQPGKVLGLFRRVQRKVAANVDAAAKAADGR